VENISGGEKSHSGMKARGACRDILWTSSVQPAQEQARPSGKHPAEYLVPGSFVMIVKIADLTIDLTVILARATSGKSRAGALPSAYTAGSLSNDRVHEPSPALPEKLPISDSTPHQALLREEIPRAVVHCYTSLHPSHHKNI
jgi:hypothetical protein